MASRIDLLAFVRLTKQDYTIAAHHELIADHLMAVARGEINRLMIFMPPRHGKSQLASRHFPAWYLGKYPSKQIILASYSDELAKAFGRDVRNLVGNPLYQEIFPGTILRQDSKSAGLWHTQQDGVFLSVGFGGGATGFGADLLLIDDPIKNPEEATSQTIKDKAWNNYKSALYDRLMPDGAIIMTLTRWAEDDVPGRALELAKETGEQWTILNLPAIATEIDVLGRQSGEALWPEWYPLETLKTIRITQGNNFWNAKYQQNPMTESGNIFKKDWWQRYTIHPRFDLIVQSWDTAFKEEEDSDYNVCTTWGLKSPNIYLIDRFKKRMEFPELKRMAETLYKKHNSSVVLIEDKASGQSLVQELRRFTELSVIPIKVDKNKIARSHAVTPIIEAGRVFLPDWAGWVDEYVDEMAKFPKGTNDDDVDSTTQALQYLKKKCDTRYEKASDKPIDRYDRRKREEISPLAV